MVYRVAGLLVCGSFFLFACSSSLLAQSARARIIGTVTDPQGAVVPGAEVTVTNVATGVGTKATTDQEGRYQALELPIGDYRVKVARQGFKTTETAKYTLEINQVLRVDVHLPVGANTETVEVTGEASLVETVNPTLGASITAAPIVDLPLNGRNVLDLAGLQPGVTPDNADDSGAGSFNIAGSRADSVTFLLDGGVDNNLLSNGVVYTPNPDAVEEFRILTSNYTAEYGRNAGGVISLVTKSGSNQVHGTLFEYNRNDTFAANSYFNNKNGIPQDPLNRNQFGFSLGGPAIKNKLFWFASYEGQRLNQGHTLSSVGVFTPEMIKGDFSHAGPNGGPDPNVVTFLQNNPFYQPDANLALKGIIDSGKIDPVAQQYIAANLIRTSPANTYVCPSNDVCSGQISAQGSEIDNFNDFTGKLDFDLTDRDKFSATIGGRRETDSLPFILNNIFAENPGFPTVTARNHYFSTLAYIKTFSPNLLNEFHFTLQRNAVKQAVPARSLPTPSQLGIGVTPDQSTGPTRISFIGGLLAGFSSQGPTSLIDNTFGTSDTVSWTKGKHNWKFGGSYLPYQNNTVFDFFVDGEFDFDSFNGSLNQYANFLLGLPEDYFQFGSAPSNIRQKSTFAFAQDEWHVANNLVLTLGVRYEYSSPKSDNQGRSFSLVPGAHSTRFPNAPVSLLFPGDPGAPKGANFPDKNDWAPRLGFAWSPGSSRSTSIRGGFGMYYDVLKGEDNLQFNGQAPFFGFTSPFFTDCPNGANSGDPNCVTANPGFMTDPFGSTGTVNPFPSKPPASNIDFGAAGFLPFGGGGVFFVDPHLRTPYTWQYNINVEHELIKSLALEAGYIGSQSRKLTTLVDSNPFDPATLSSTPHRVLNEIESVDDGRFSFLPTFENAVNANYNAFEAKLSKKSSENRFLGNSYFTLSYTYAHSIDNSSGFRNRTFQIPFFDRNAFRTSSDFDVRHQIAFSGGWTLPFDRLWQAGPKRLTNGWDLFPIVTWHTGYPLDVNANLSTRRTNPGPSGAGDSAIVYANLTGPITYSNPDNPTPNQLGNNFFDGSVFTDDGLTGCHCYGSGRATLRGPDRVNTDFAVAKKTSITEHTAIELRAEFFNVFNHAEFANPDTNLSSPTFGQVTSTFDPRILQFAARFSF
jgi:outer membrane receptor protein involved in Fe transport